MVGLQFARGTAPPGHLVAISGAHRAHPFSSAWRALQRRAVALGALQCDEIHGLALARAAGDPQLPHAGGIRRALRRGAGHRRPRARRRRGLPRPLRRAVRARTSPRASALSESIDLQAVDAGIIACR
jgi:homoserine O-acetyltransferase